MWNVKQTRKIMWISTVNLEPQVYVYESKQPMAKWHNQCRKFGIMEVLNNLLIVSYYLLT